jgi:hypothetical protein
MFNISKFNYTDLTATQAQADATNKAQDESQKMFFSFLDGLQKQHELREKYNSYKIQMGTLADFTKTGLQGIGQVKKWQAADKAWKEWNPWSESFANNNQDDPQYQAFEAKEAAADEIKGNMQTIGKAKSNEGDPYTAQKFYEGTLGRDTLKKNLQSAVPQYKAAIAHWEKSWAVTCPDGQKRTLEQCSNPEDIKYVIGEYRRAFLSSLVGEDGEVNQNMIRKYAFRKMHEVEKNKLTGKTAAMLKTVEESASNERDNELIAGMESGGPEAFLTWMNTYKGVFSGGVPEEQINHSFVREQAFGHIARLVADGKMPVSVAEPLLRHQFPGWDGSTKMIYDDQNRSRKPYWKEAQVLARAIDKKKRDDTKERTANRNATLESNQLDILNRFAEMAADPKITITQEMRNEAIKEYLQNNNTNIIPPALSGILAEGEEDDHQIKHRLQKWHDGGINITADMARGIDDLDTKKWVLDNLVGKGDIPDGTKDYMAGRIENVVETYTGKLGEQKGGVRYGAISGQAETAVYAEYRRLKALSPTRSDSDVANEAVENIAANIQNRKYDEWPAANRTNDSQVNLRTALTAIREGKTNFNNDLIPGFDNHAKAAYEHYTGTRRIGNNAATKPYSTLVNIEGVSKSGSLDPLLLTQRQANLYAQREGLPLIDFDKSQPVKIQKVLNAQPSQVNALLSNKNNGNGTVRAYTQLINAGSLSEVIEATKYPGARNNGGVDAVLTPQGWVNGKTLFGNEGGKTTLQEYLDHKDVTAIGEHAVSKPVLKNLIETFGWDTNTPISELADILPIAKALADVNARSHVCGVVNHWNRLNIDPKQWKKMLTTLGYNDDALLLKSCQGKQRVTK